MKINYNVSAGIANKHLLGIENNLSKSMERLSSGLKINRAKDNPAGMAISNKMQAQINGLNRASSNASDGISVIQIADGALTETTSILQRMRELSVQAASDGTMSPEDKKAIQDEIDSLKEEIDRISKDTEYNSKPLLDGTLDTRVYTNNASRVQISDFVNPGTYSLKIEQAAKQAGPVITDGADYNSNTAVGQSGTMTINGSKVEIDATDTYAEAYEKIRNAAETGEAIAQRDETTGAVTFTSEAYGKESILKITFDNENLGRSLGFVASGDFDLVEDIENGVYVYGKKDGANILSPAGSDPVLSADRDDWEGFSSSATVSFNGNKITVSDVGGFSISFLAEEGYQFKAAVPDDPGTGDVDESVPEVDGKIEFEVTDIGTMTLHIGANKDQNMEVRIPEVSSKSLYVDDMDVTTVNGADRAIASFDKALAQVSSVRSKLGAYENRLEHSTSSLDTFEENMTGAVSRLTDVDMAEEMTNYTHMNVLNQAAISVLTQANDLPQQVLQILQ